MSQINKPGGIVIRGIRDTRWISLDKLASDNTGTPSENLRQVLPADETGRVATAAFGSSI